MSEYTEQAEQFLKSRGLEFRAVLIGSDCPAFCKDAETETDMDKLDTFPRKTHIHGKHYRCTISGTGRGHVSFDFWNSYSDEEENFFAFGNHDSLNNWVTGRENMYWDKYRTGKYPSRPRLKTPHTVSAYDLLACIQKSDPGTFEDFCGDFGYDSDSRKAEQTYHAVVKEWKKVQRFFTADEITALQEIN